jgi:hypothetical protein
MSDKIQVNALLLLDVPEKDRVKSGGGLRVTNNFNFDMLEKLTLTERLRKLV